MTTPSPSTETTVRHPREGLITLAHVIYALHAFSALTGLASSVLVVTTFVTGWPSIIAVILNYAKRSEVRDTWLDGAFGGEADAAAGAHRLEPRRVRAAQGYLRLVLDAAANAALARRTR